MKKFFTYILFNYMLSLAMIAGISIKLFVSLKLLGSLRFLPEISSSKSLLNFLFALS